MNAMIRSLAAALLLAAYGAAFAAGDTGGGAMPPWPADDDSPKARYGKATARGDFGGAAGVMREALGREPGNADYHNLYAYALRKGPNAPMDLVFRHYNEALRIDPRHAGAHEYLGEAYLMSGNVAKAKEHLAQLEGICGNRCEETGLLRKAIAEHEARKR